MDLRFIHCRSHHLGLVTATLLLSLTSTIYGRPEGLPLAGTLLGINAPSAQAQTPQEGKDEAVRLYDVGLQQLNTGQFREGLQTFEQVLGLVRATGDRKMEGTVLNNLAWLRLLQDLRKASICRVY